MYSDTTHYIVFNSNQAKNTGNLNPTDNEDIRYSKDVDFKKKTAYNEFNTLAMQWAHSNKTNVGDTKIINRGGKNFVLIEATEDGYIELATGNYNKVRSIYERIYGEQALSLWEHLERVRSQEGRDRWDIIVNDERENGRRDSKSFGSQTVQNNTTGNNEYLRSGNQRESDKVKFSLDVPVEQTKTRLYG